MLPFIAVYLFQSTPLMRGETTENFIQCTFAMISIHSPHARGDALRQTAPAGYRHFNPLPSCEGRPEKPSASASAGNFNPLPSCEGRLTATGLLHIDSEISIHSPHARGDYPGLMAGAFFIYFNPLPSCEGRLRNIYERRRPGDFNPLPSYEGRPHRAHRYAERFNFNPLPSYEGRLCIAMFLLLQPEISIHSPHTRGDYDNPKHFS